MNTVICDESFVKQRNTKAIVTNNCNAVNRVEMIYQQTGGGKGWP